MVQLIRRDGSHPFDLLLSDLDRMLGGTLGLPLRSGDVSMDVDVSETEDEIVVRAEVPGIEPGDLEVQVEGNLLTIAGEKREEAEEERRGWRHTERRFGQVRRSFTLPSHVDAGQVTAEHRNGVLTVRLPKFDEAKAKRIPVSSK
jgi:HSP20 family protein